MREFLKNEHKNDTRIKFECLQDEGIVITTSEMFDIFTILSWCKENALKLRLVRIIFLT